MGNFKFAFLRRAVAAGSELSQWDKIILTAKYAIRKVAGSQAQWYGLDTSSLIIEYVPLVIAQAPPANHKPVRIAGELSELPAQEIE